MQRCRGAEVHRKGRQKCRFAYLQRCRGVAGADLQICRETVRQRDRVEETEVQSDRGGAGGEEQRKERQMRWCRRVKVQKCTGSEMHRKKQCRCTVVELQSSRVAKVSWTCRCAVVQVQRCRGLEVQNCRAAEV